jgi:hypothetical protein
LTIKFLSLSEIDPGCASALLIETSWPKDWGRELAESFFNWRYRMRGNGETFVAWDQGRCVGMLDSFMRPYWTGGRQQVVRETCSWFCLPEYRALGVGLHLMRRVMARTEPILVIGGTDYTKNLLPRLNWARLPDVGNFILGISAKTTAGLLAHGRWPIGERLARAIPDVSLVRRLPHLPPPSTNCQVRVSTPSETGQVPKIAPYAFAPEIDQKVLDWFAGAPELLGEFPVLSFFCDGELVGTSISRLKKLSSLGFAAQIVHLHAARFDVIEWMASATVHHLIGRGAGVITCRTSCPTTAKALSVLRFRQRKAISAYWWSRDPPPAGALLLSELQADEALQLD